MPKQETSSRKRKKRSESTSPIIAQNTSSSKEVITKCQKVYPENMASNNDSDSKQKANIPPAGNESSLLAIILDSLNKLHEKFDSQKQSHDKLSMDIFGEQGIEPRVTQTEAQCDDNTSEISDLKGKYESLKKEQTILLGIVSKQNKQIEVLSNKLDDLVTRSMKENIIISGLDETESGDEGDDSLEEKVRKFFDEKMSIAPRFDITHRIGEKREDKGPRPVVVRCSGLKEKSKIFQNVNKLKDQKNSRGKPYFVSDQYPDGINERRRKYNSMMNENKSLPTTEQLSMRIRRNQLFINNEVYRPSVVPPSVDDLFDVPQSEQDKMEKLPLTFGDIQSEKGSTFYGAAVRIHSIADVRRAYKKVVLGDPSATHVMAAFKYKSPQGKILVDYIDDGEHGGSRCLMNSITLGGHMGVACFVVRHYGGTHLGPRRFNHITAAAKSALFKLFNK